MTTHDRLPVPGIPHPPRQRSATRSWNRFRLPISEETSAGGLCVRVDRGIPFVAVIARRGRNGKLEWCLPKGHLENGETAVEAARREIEEEAGVRGEPIQRLCTIDYWFSSPRSRVHKTVHHYLFEYVGGEITVDNDPDQEAEEAAWVPLRAALTKLAYPNERRVVQVALELLYQGSQR
ncbi:NUDIX hydrolase [Scrofimicrobium sp. R131]|uniref:NUDIX hydrolase n=1 Tax=Scrofimicrobium appendicitidis TaxID=3079930 RepID=A0AAU7V6Z6_9ACTO